MSDRTRVRVGLLGVDLDLSLSRVLHETEGSALGLDYSYDVFDANHHPEYHNVAATLETAQRGGYAGINITHPFKQVAVAHVDEMSDDARILGAVNTVVFTGGRSVGHNTDWYGFAKSISKNLSGVPRRLVVQFGAGGAGVAVAHALLRSGVGRLVVVDIDTTRSRAVADLLNAAHARSRAGAGAVEVGTVDDAARWVRDADGIVNTTPLGMPAHPGTAVPVTLLRRRLWVHDVVYMPLETTLMAAARARGCLTVGGGDMLVFQAAEGFRLFTGITPDVDRMLAHLERIIANGAQTAPGSRFSSDGR
jgi:shikimate dehydrogenase